MNALPSKPLLSRVFEEPFLRRLQWPMLRGLLDLRAGQSVLDVGAGRMRYAIRLARTGARVIAVDLEVRPEDVAWARRRGVEALAAEACDLPLPDASVDRILMSSVLQMVAEPELVLGECRRVLKPGGHAVLSVPNHYRYASRVLGSPSLRRFLQLPESPEALEAELNARFGVAGPQGHYGSSEIECLVRSTGFLVSAHRYAPGLAGTILWELGVLAFKRFGSIAFHVLLPVTPVAWISDSILPNADSGEHILRIEVAHGE